MSVTIEFVARQFTNRWMERRGGKADSMQLHFFEVSIVTALDDAIGEDEIAFAELLPSGKEESTDYGTALVLTGMRLLTMQVSDDAIVVIYLGELPGGEYEERLQVEDEIIGRTIRYVHPRLPGGQLEFEVSSSTAHAKRFEPLRRVLRKWSTAQADSGAERS